MMSLKLLAFVVILPSMIDWSSLYQFDDGHEPRMAMNDANTVIEVHRSNNLIDTTALWYHVGQMSSDGSIQWGDGHPFNVGQEVAVAMNRRYAIEVHTTSGNEGTLWYEVGSVDAASREVDWGNAYQYDTGRNAAVAINNLNVVVEVHQASDRDTGLWYHVGRIVRRSDGSRGIAWGASHYYGEGYYPSVAVNDNGDIVEVHDALSGGLDRTIGTVDVYSLSIEFSASIGYDSGTRPTIALRNDGTLAEIHRTATYGRRGIWYHTGRLALNDVHFSRSHYLTDGETPSIAINNNGFAAQVHEDDGLWCQAGQFR
jgi:hypothetical protein